MIGCRLKTRVVFLYGFAKNERDNIDDDELATLREIAATWLTMDDANLTKALADKRAEEIAYDKED